jgi:hypothetical protein
MTNENDAGDPPYRVGPGRPPKHSQFPKGQSGNPKGRPHGTLNKKTLRQLAAAVLLDSTIPLNERGRKREIPKLEGLVQRLVQLGLEGDRRAIKDTLEWVERIAGPEPEPSAGAGESNAEDQAILRRFVGHAEEPSPPDEAE